MRSLRSFTRPGFMILVAIAGGAATAVSVAGGLIEPGAHVSDFTLPVVRGGAFSFHRAAHQPFLIAFLQTIPDTADTPSRSQVALLESMDHQYSPRGLRVVIIDASAFAIGHKPTHDSLVNASYDWNLHVPLLEDEGGRVAQMFGVTHVPAMTLVKDDGTVAQIWGRPVAPGELAIAIERVLARGQQAPNGTPQVSK